jgi:hypothetical protein
MMAAAAHWHDGQIMHDAHARFARRADSVVRFSSLTTHDFRNETLTYRYDTITFYRWSGVKKSGES